MRPERRPKDMLFSPKAFVKVRYSGTLPMLSRAGTIGVFVATLVLILVRPRGIGEAVWAVLGAAAVIALGGVSGSEVVEIVWGSRNAMLFLVALLLLSALLEASGFFEWAAVRASRAAGGDDRRLFRNVILLGGVVTVMLSLDTTAVMLTPIVVAFVTRLGLPARPYVVATAFVANIASLALPISNLTNLLMADIFQIPFGRYVLRMLLPQGVAVIAMYVLLRWCFRRELGVTFDPAALPEPASVVGDRVFFRTAAVVLALVLGGYFAAPVVALPPYVLPFAGALVLGVVGVVRGRVRAKLVREISWGVFPLVFGLFVVVRAVENLGLIAVSSRWLATVPAHGLGRVLSVASATSVASNVMNNLPATLLARSTLHAAHASERDVFAALFGLNIGPTILPTASLATLLVLDVARRKGAPIRGLEILRIGIWVTPILVVLTALVFEI